MFIRRSNLKLFNIKKIYNEKDTNVCIEYMLSNSEIMNMLKITSPSLYFLIEKKKDKENIIENSKIKFSLQKYFLRMCSRAVNYDLLGAVSNEKISCDYIRISISSEWLNDFTDKMNFYQKSNSNLMLYLNNNLLNFKYYYLLHGFSRKNKTQQTIKINKNTILGNVVEYIIECDKRIEYKDLYNILKEYNLSDSTTKMMIDSLFSNEIINSDIMFSYRDCENISCLLNFKEYYLDMEHLIKDIICSFDKIKILKKLNDVNIQLINEFEKKMKILLGEFNYNRKILVYERYVSFDNYKIQMIDPDKLTILRYFNFITRDYNNIKYFCNQLIMKYGENFKKSLMKLIEEDDFVYEFIFDNKANDNNINFKKQVYEEYILRLIEKTLLKGEKILKITDENIFTIKNLLLDRKDSDLYEILVDCKFQVIKEKKYLASLAFSYPCGSFESKHIDIALNEAKDNTVVNYNLKTNYYPDVGRNFMKKETDINFFYSKDNETGLDDIFIGLHNGELYLEDYKKGLKVIPQFQSLADLTYGTENMIAKFLNELGRFIMLPPINLFSNSFLKLPYMPRIEIDDFILSKERWIFNVYSQKKIDRKLFIQEFKFFVQEYKIPNNVCINIDGEELPVCINTTLGEDILYQSFQKHNYLILTEYFYDKYNSEYFVEYIQDIKFPGKKYKQNDVNNEYILENTEISGYDTFIIIIKKSVNDILQVLYRLHDYMINQQIKYFYVNYFEDERKSIRLRIYKESENYNIKDIFSILYELQKENFINYFYIGPYHNELNRYGGIAVSKIINNIFIFDTLNSIQYFKKEKRDKQYLVAYIVITIMKYFYVITSDLLNEFYKKYIRKNYAELYRKEINNAKIDNYLSLIMDENIEYIDLLNNYYLYTNEKQMDLREKLEIILSVVHMICNRRFVSGVEEEQVYYFVYKELSRMLYKNGGKL